MKITFIQRKKFYLYRYPVRFVVGHLRVVFFKPETFWSMSRIKIFKILFFLNNRYYKFFEKCVFDIKTVFVYLIKQ